MISGMYSSGAVSTMSQLWSLSDVALDHTIQDILAIRQQTEMKYFKLLRLQAQQSKKLKTIHRKHIHTKD